MRAREGDPLVRQSINASGPGGWSDGRRPLSGVHVPQAIAEQLLRRGVDLVTAIEDGCAQLRDEDLLDRSSSLGRVMFTQDIRFKVLAEDWQRQGRPFGGLLFGHQRGATIGKYVSDLELVAKATDPGDWVGVVEHLPF